MVFYRKGGKLVGRKSPVAVKGHPKRSVWERNSTAACRRGAQHEGMEAARLSMAQLQTMEFKQAFEEFDKDRSGTISTKELLPVMRSMGQNPTEDEVLSLVIEYDVNGNGKLDFDEFMEMMRKQAEHQDNSAELREAFKIFDRDGNGFIDAAELKKVVMGYGHNKLSLEEAEELLKEADLDGDGKLDYTEFTQMMLWDLED